MADFFLELGLDSKPLESDLEKVKQTAKRKGGEAGNNFGSEFSNRASKGFNKLLGVAAAAGTAIAGALFTRASIRAAQEQEDAVNRVNSALFQAGEFSQQASQDIQDFASALQRTTRFGDEVILSQIAYSKSLGISTDQTKQLVTASADLASALGISLESANRNLTKTFGGLVGELGELVPEVKNLTREQLLAGDAVTLIGQKFRGFAERDALTFSGATDQLKNNFGDLLEQIGFLVTQNPAFIGSVGVLSKGFIALGDIIKNNQAAFIDLVQNGFSIVITGSAFVVDSVLVIARAFNSAQAAFNSFQNAIEINTILDKLDALPVQLDATGKKVTTFYEQALLDQLDALQKANVLDEEAFIRRTELIDQFRESINTSIAGIQETLLESSGEGGIFDSLGQQAEAAASQVSTSLEKVQTDTAKSAQQTQAIAGALTSGISRSIQFLGQSLVTGENFFKGFLGIAINAIGDLLIAFGTGAIATGAVAEALRASIASLAGGQAIVAGLAAIAAGGALKAFSGSLGASSQGPTLASPTGTPDGGVISPASDFAQTQEEERRTDQSIQVVIQGDVYDSEETGSRILKALTDNFKNTNSALVDARLA